jgi:hypothetical protein
MKQIITLLFVALLSCPVTMAQYPTPPLSKPLLSEVEMRTWPADPLAEAVVLSDNGETRFFQNVNGGLDIQFTRTTKIKIINEAGLTFGNVEIPLQVEDNQNLEYIMYVEGKVHNIENGSVITTKFNTKQIYEEQISKNLIRKKFALPNVKAGSLIEYTYSVISPFKFNCPDWRFQWKIPVVKSRYLLGVIPFYEYIFLFQGAMKLSSQKSWDGTMTHKISSTTYIEKYYEFVMNNVPAFRDENYITSVEDNIIKIDFQLARINHLDGSKKEIISTWKALSQELMKANEFGKYISAAEKNFKNKLPFELSSDTLSNVKAIIEYVKTQFEWNNSYRLFAGNKVSDLMTRKKGNSAEKNLFALGMMSAAGIDATPVLISTRSHGRIATEYPFVNAFNHTLIYVNINNTPYLLDATDPYCPFGLLPLQCINNKGYMVDKKNSDNWVMLGAAQPSQIVYALKLSPDPKSETISTLISATASNYDAIKWRQSCIADLEEFKKTQFYNIQIDSFKTENLENIDKRLLVKATGESEIDKASGNIVVNPFNGLCESVNIFKSEKREYAVDFTYSYRRDFTSTIEIPEGYDVKSLPSICNVSTPQMQFSRTETRDGNKLIINASYAFTKAIYPPEEYRELKNSFAQMAKRLNSEIILSPIEPDIEAKM